MKGLDIRTSWRLILDEFKDRIVEKCIHFLIVKYIYRDTIFSQNFIIRRFFFNFFERYFIRVVRSTYERC